MRRPLLLLTLLVLLAANALAVEVQFRSDGELPAGYEQQVRASLEELLLPRLEESSTLAAHLDGQRLLTLVTEHGSLAVALPPKREEVADALLFALQWDGQALLSPLAGARLSYPLSYGFMLAAVDQPRQGRPYWVVSRDGRRMGSVRIMRVVDEEIVVGTQTSGGALLPHMGIEAKGTLYLGVYGTATREGGFGVEAVVGHLLPLYPFSAYWGIGYGSDESVTLRLGIGAELALSHLLGTGSAVGRNMAVEGRADLGLGWSGGLLLAASARIGLAYHLSSWKVSALVGNRVGATEAATVHRGLFFTLGTAYTYTP